MWYISEIEAKTGIPENTLRRYARLFADYIESRTINRRTKYSNEAIDVFNRIADLYNQGYSTPEIKDLLDQEVPKEITVKQEKTPATERLTKALETLADQKERIERIEEREQELTRESQELHQEMDKLNKRLDNIETRKRRPWWKIF